MADTQATIDETKPVEAAVPVNEVHHEQPMRREMTDEEADHHFAAIRELIQSLRNRGDQDNNKVLDNITGHLDAIDPQEEAA